MTPTAGRLRKPAEFLDVRVRGKRAGDSLLMFGSVPAGGGETKFGLAVGRRVGNAVTRNRVKRRLRECFRAIEFEPGHNIVVAARPAAAQADYHMLLSALRRLARRSGVLAESAAELETPSKTGTGTEKAV